MQASFQWLNFYIYENTYATVLAQLSEFIAYSSEFVLWLFGLYTLGSMKKGNNSEFDFLHVPEFECGC